jgi:alanine dehydrogenase
MIIGLVKEIKNHEYRVGLTPDCVRAYVSKGHEVLMEKGAGIGSGFDDKEYIAAGAKIVSDTGAVWNKAEMIVKVKEPVAAEYGYLRENLILFTYLHLAADKPLTETLLKTGTAAVAYETITDESGGQPCLAPMSEIAGRMSVLEGAKYLEKTYGGRGILLPGVPGVCKGKIVIIGGGNVGTNACKIAVGMGANVTILDVNIKRLAYLDDIFGGSIQTVTSTPDAIRNAISDADVVIGAVLIPGRKAPQLISKTDLSLMKKGSVLVDVAVDQGGCFETTHPTTHQEPTFVVDDVVHYCVANMPGAVARTATVALTNVTLPYGLQIASMGLIQAINHQNDLVSGVNCFRGKCTCKGVAEAIHVPVFNIMDLI